MALAPCTRLGPYDIPALLGVKGLGEVYRATDRNLNLQVAIEVLPDAVAGDAERLVRFQGEAQVLAALNHPKIAQICGPERSAGTIALVMELIDGPILADSIAQGALPVDEVIPIARQIDEALESAHERGIVRRDLKPANVKVLLDGTVKVLDFGLARGVGSGGLSLATNIAVADDHDADHDAGRDDPRHGIYVARAGQGPPCRPAATYGRSVPCFTRCAPAKRAFELASAVAFTAAVVGGGAWALLVSDTVRSGREWAGREWASRRTPAPNVEKGRTRG